MKAWGGRGSLVHMPTMRKTYIYYHHITILLVLFTIAGLLSSTPGEEVDLAYILNPYIIPLLPCHLPGVYYDICSIERKGRSAYLLTHLHLRYIHPAAVAVGREALCYGRHVGANYA